LSILYDLSNDAFELNNLAGTGHPAEVDLTALAEKTWSLDTLLDEVNQSQMQRKLVDSALAIGREEHWDFVPKPLQQNSQYVRRGDAFPEVERRGYLAYKKVPD